SRLGPSAAVQDRKVPTTEVVIRTSRTRRGLSQHPAKERVALLGDLAEPLLVSRCVDRGSQAHITDDVFAVRKALDGPENEDGGEGGHRTDAGMREQEPGVWIDRGHAGDVLVELVDASGEPAEQLEIVVATAGRVSGKHEGVELGQPGPTPQLRAKSQANVQGHGLQLLLDHGTRPGHAGTAGLESA